MQNLDIIEINDEQAYNAKLLASVMSSPQIRKAKIVEVSSINVIEELFLFLLFLDLFIL